MYDAAVLAWMTGLVLMQGPAVDRDVDGAVAAIDGCPDLAETVNGYRDDDGCPDTGDPKVIYEDGEFKILEAIQFEHGSARLTKESESTVDQVALTLKANNQIKKVRVEGHTDDTGPRDVNIRLSQQRAEAVRQRMVQKGVSPRRLTSEGYGPDKPLEKGTSDSARAKNRRVQFIVTE